MSPLFFSKLKAQSISQDKVRDYRVFRIKEDLALGADFGALTSLVEAAVKKGNVKIALKFTPRSYLYTPTVARLVEYYTMLQKHGGELCLLQPNEDIVKVLETIGLTKWVRIAATEDDL